MKILAEHDLPKFGCKVRMSARFDTRLAMGPAREMRHTQHLHWSGPVDMPGQWLPMVVPPPSGAHEASPPASCASRWVVELERKNGMRTIGETIESILDVVPDSETDLRADLERVAEGSRYTAPEASNTDWRKALYVLEHRIGKPTEPWQLQVRDIFVGCAS